MRMFSSTRQIRRAGYKSSAFTLIEVLVVVAIIALLVAILIPSLKKARDQAKKTTCATNLHQIAVALSAYSTDHQGELPYRGWMPYTVAETPHESLGEGGNERFILSNLGLLRGGLGYTNGKNVLLSSYISWVGKEWDVLYCPNMLHYQKDLCHGLDNLVAPYCSDIPEGPRGIVFIFGGYEYATPLNPRGPRTNAKGGSSPSLGESNVYPRDCISGEYWQMLQTKQGIDDDNDWKTGDMPRISKGCQALVSDWIFGMDIKKAHNGGINVMYSDGHVKFFQFATMPADVQALLDSGGGRRASADIWYFYNTNQ